MDTRKMRKKGEQKERREEGKCQGGNKQENKAGSQYWLEVGVQILNYTPTSRLFLCLKFPLIDLHYLPSVNHFSICPLFRFLF